MSTQTEKPKNQLRIKLENVRLSYPNLFTAKGVKQPDGTTSKPKFTANFLLDKKTHAATIAKLEKMIERAMLDKFGKKVNLKNVCLHDGNEQEEKDGYGDEVMYLVAKSDTRPAVVDQKVNPVTEEDGKIYAGCYVNATVEIFGYKHQLGGNGVSAQLRAVQFVRDGESFGAGRVDASEEFDEVKDEDVDGY